MEYKTLIVPFDFSDNAMAAAKLAAKLAAVTAGEVILAHGMQLPALPSPNPAISAAELGESIRAHVEKRLQEVHALLGVKGGCLVRTEPPESWLNAYAVSVPAPLIVLGRHGWSGKQEGLGSTAKKITRASQVPVWVAGKQTELPARVLAAMETDPMGEKCAAAAHGIAARMAGECRFMHVRDPRIETGYLSEIGWPPAVNVFDELRREAEEFLRNLAAKYANPKPSAVVLAGSPAPTIVQEAKQYEADLVVVGKHAKGAIERVFLGSTTEAVLKGWGCHMLVLS